MNDLKEIWLKTTADHMPGNADEWSRIEEAYSEPGRHYHTLLHLSDVYDALMLYYDGDVPLSSLLALFYHDLVYNTLRGDNEKQSADQASAVLNEWKIDASVVKRVCDIILATTKHESSDPETMVFLDADMAILGADAEIYHDYAQKVRREYSIYPDLLYNPGRRKFVESTLKREKIFLTEAFQKKYEEQAWINLTNELNLLG
jgi:predicted metal-dependent HD superfamily phosphohydrolase